VTRKAITTSHAVVSCDVCGRTLLRGEHADVFLHGGQRRMVCELCKPLREDTASRSEVMHSGEYELTVKRRFAS